MTPIKQVYVAYNVKDGPSADSFSYCPRCRAELVVKEVECRSRSVCSACGFIRFRNPAPAVSLLIVRNGQVLLGKRSGEPGKGQWATPSGYVEYEDDFLTAAIREAREETGLEVELESILNVTSSFLSPQHHFLAVYLLARVVGGELAAGDDMEEVAWFPLSGPFPELAFAEDADILAAYARMHFEGLAVDPEFAKSGRA
jgi:ADP-ribose pyrophosphatase YjhB (NUDIX family)